MDESSSETVGSMKLASGELKENVGKECREDAELFEAVSVWWIVLHCITVRW